MSSERMDETDIERRRILKDVEGKWETLLLLV